MIGRKDGRMEYLVVLGFVLMALLILASPTLMRLSVGKPLVRGSVPYYHMAMARAVSDGAPLDDPSAYGGRPYVPNLYHLLLAYLSTWMSLEKIGRAHV